MNKIDWDTVTRFMLMVIGFGLIWQYSNGWIVLGLILIGNVLIQPLNAELKEAKAELDSLRTENNNMKQKMDFLYKTAYQENND